VSSAPLGSLPIVITSAIAVSAGQTVVVDPSVRLSLTLDSVRLWRLTPHVASVVVCDGSGYDLAPAISAMPMPSHAAPFEVLTFANDSEMVRKRGKGFGEGEILNYALTHSETLRSAASFAKCTGKLWVENYADCSRQFNGNASFDFAGFLRLRQIDTRFYIVSRNFYSSHLATAYQSVSDSSGYYLEHAFKSALSGFKLAEYVMLPTPRIRGVSGSTGLHYSTNRIRGVLRDYRSRVLKTALY